MKPYYCENCGTVYLIEDGWIESSACARPALHKGRLRHCNGQLHPAGDILLSALAMSTPQPNVPPPPAEEQA